MPSEFQFGSYYKYMIADKTDSQWASSPVQDSSMPLYLGLGSQVPDASFMHDGRAYFVEDVIEEGHDLNPFPCPLVIAGRQ